MSELPLRALSLAVGPSWGLNVWQSLPMSLERRENRFSRTSFFLLNNTNLVNEKNTVIREQSNRNFVKKELQ